MTIRDNIDSEYLVNTLKNDDIKIIRSGFLVWILKVTNKIFRQNMAIMVNIFTMNFHSLIDISDELIYHELIHLLQVKENGRLGFLFKYMWQSIKTMSYSKNGFEVEAYINDAKFYNLPTEWRIKILGLVK